MVLGGIRLQATRPGAPFRAASGSLVPLTGSTVDNSGGGGAIVATGVAVGLDVGGGETGGAVGTADGDATAAADGEGDGFGAHAPTTSASPASSAANRRRATTSLPCVVTKTRPGRWS